MFLVVPRMHAQPKNLPPHVPYKGNAARVCRKQTVQRTAVVQNARVHSWHRKVYVTYVTHAHPVLGEPRRVCLLVASHRGVGAEGETRGRQPRGDGHVLGHGSVSGTGVRVQGGCGSKGVEVGVLQDWVAGGREL
jgi:hypothetical protein